MADQLLLLLLLLVLLLLILFPAKRSQSLSLNGIPGRVGQRPSPHTGAGHFQRENTSLPLRVTTKGRRLNK